MTWMTADINAFTYIFSSNVGMIRATYLACPLYWERTKMIASNEELLDILYEELLTEDRWIAFLKELSGAFDANLSVLILRHPTDENIGTIVQYGNTRLPSLLGKNEYSSGMFKDNPFRGFTQNKAMLLNEIVDRKMLHSTRFYKDLMDARNIYDVIGVELHHANEVDATLYLTRKKSAARFSPQYVSKLDNLIPHLVRSLRISHKLEVAQSEIDFYSSLTVQFNAAVIFLNKDMEIVHVNMAGKSLDYSVDAFEIITNKIEFDDRESRKTFNEICKKAILEYERGNSAYLDVLRIDRRSGQPLVLVVKSLPDRPHEVAESDPVISVIVRDPAHEIAAPQELLQKLFGFTAAEGNLAMRIVNGDSVEKAACHFGISVNTARAHLRAIFNKAGVINQQQLIRLIIKCVPHIS